MIVRNRAAFYLGRRFPCVIGRGGLVADKREGDGGTPTGALRMAALCVPPEMSGAGVQHTHGQEAQLDVV